MFDSWLPFLQLTIKYEEDTSFHLKTFFYKVNTSKGGYIILIEEYVHDFFIVKFYPLRFKRHPNKFNLIANDGVLQVVVGTSLRILLKFLEKNPRSSFGFIASSSIIDNLIEARSNNQRYRIYRQVMQNFFGEETFAHFADVLTSTYLMVNKLNTHIDDLVSEMQQKFGEMYPDIFNLQFTQI